MAERFPITPRPQEVYSNPNGDSIITFNLLNKPLQEMQVYPAIREMQRVINHAYPESTRIRPKQIQTEAGSIGWFAFVTGGIKEDSIHCMFILSVEDNMMFGSYHFPAEEMATDRRILVEILKSIRLQEVSAMRRQAVGNETAI